MQMTVSDKRFPVNKRCSLFRGVCRGGNSTPLTHLVKRLSVIAWFPYVSKEVSEYVEFPYI